MTGINQGMTNFLIYLAQTDAERARDGHRSQISLQRRALPLRLRAGAGHTALSKSLGSLAARLVSPPKIRRINNVLEDLYEVQIPFNFYVQKHRTEEFKKLLLGMAQMAVWPHPPIGELLQSDPADLIKIIPVRNARSVFEYLMYYDGPNAPN